LKGETYSIYSISILRIILGIGFFLVGVANIFLIDTSHEVGVLFSLPYYVTTGIPPALFGIGILLHTLFNSFKFTLSRVDGEIHLEEKFVFRRTKIVKMEEIQSIRLGDTRNRYKYAIFGLWLVYVIFTLKSGFHQLNDFYATVFITSGLIVLVLSTLFIFMTRKEIVLRTAIGQTFATVTKINLPIVREILQIPPETTEKSKTYRMNDYPILIIGLLFIGIAFIVYFILPFSTFIDIFLLIYGLKLIFSVINHSTGTITVTTNESEYLIHKKGPLRETIFLSKSNAACEPITKFKSIHLFELGIIAFLCFQVMYATIRAVFLADLIFVMEAVFLAFIILLSIGFIMFRLENYLHSKGHTFYSLPIPLELVRWHETAKKQQSKEEFWEKIIKYSQTKALYYRLVFFFVVLIFPLIIFTLGYPVLV